MQSLHRRNAPGEVMDGLERLARATGTSVSAVAVGELGAAMRRVDNVALAATLACIAISAEEIVDTDPS